jgi:tetratricopeptide (TPR) repeat protein
LQNRNIVIGTGVVGLLVLFGIVGYFIGMQSLGKGKAASTQGGEVSASPSPANNSTLIEELKASLKAKPDDPEIMVHLGDAYFDLKQFNEAVTYYKMALAKKPNDAEIFNDIGLSVHYLGNSPEGLRYVEEGLKKNPYHQRVWLTKGFILAYGMGDLEGARAAWEKARTLNPESQVGKAASEFLAQFNKK